MVDRLIVYAAVVIVFLLITKMFLNDRDEMEKANPTVIMPEKSDIEVEITEDEMRFTLSLKSLGLKVDNDEGEKQ